MDASSCLRRRVCSDSMYHIDCTHYLTIFQLELIWANQFSYYPPHVAHACLLVCMLSFKIFYTKSKTPRFAKSDKAFKNLIWSCIASIYLTFQLVSTSRGRRPDCWNHNPTSKWIEYVPRFLARRLCTSFTWYETDLAGSF